MDPLALVGEVPGISPSTELGGLSEQREEGWEELRTAPCTSTTGSAPQPATASR